MFEIEQIISLDYCGHYRFIDGDSKLPYWIFVVLVDWVNVEIPFEFGQKLDKWSIFMVLGIYPFV